jgi:hypothetical protein
MTPLPARRTGMIESNLALFPGWQVGPQPQQKRIARRDLLGAIARAERAPLGELELDTLTWLTQEWYEQGSPTDGVIRFTWYRLGRDLYGRQPAGREHRLLQEAVDNLAAVLVTLRCIGVISGTRDVTLRSKVHILEAIEDHEDVLLIRDGERSQGSAGWLRDDTVKVKLADWLVAQLLDGLIVLDWQIQRQLGGAAKRLWYYLAARAVDFAPDPGGEVERLVVDVDSDFYASLSLQAARERDNRSALGRAGARIVAVDPAYRAVEVNRGRGGYVLAVTRVAEEAPVCGDLATVSALQP